MYIKSISLKNIRSYADTTVTFPDGIILLSGDIGSGKSTLLQAIEFGLFGAQRGLIDSSNLLRHGASEGEVSITLYSDSEIIIQRGLKATKNGIIQTPGSLTFDKNTEVYAPTELRSRILSLLGYPDTITPFRYTVYASQEHMKQILQEKPDIRLDTLRVIFGVDKYKQIVDNVEIIQRILRKQRSFYEGQLDDFTEKKLALAELKQREMQISKNLTEIQKNVAEKKSELIISEDLLKKVRLQSQEFSVLSQELKTLQSRTSTVADIQNKIQKYSEEFDVISKEKIELPEFDESLVRKLREIVLQQKTLIAKLEEKKISLEKKLSDIDNLSDIINEIKKLDEDFILLSDKSKKLDQAIHENVTRQADLKHLEQQYAELVDHQKQLEGKSTCPTCGQIVDEEHKKKISIGAQEKLQKIALQKEALSKFSTNPSLELENTTVAIQKIISKKSMLESKKEQALQKPSLESELSVIISKLKTLAESTVSQELVVLEEKEKKYRVLKEKEQQRVHKKGELERTLIDLRERLFREEAEDKKMASRIAEIRAAVSRYDPSILENAENDFIEKQKIFQKVVQEETSLKTEQTLLSKQIIAASEEVTKKKIAYKKQTWIDTVQSWLKQYFVPLVKSIEQKVLSQIYAEFSRSFSEWFSRLIEDESFGASLDLQFTPKITQNGYDVDFDALSGGERTSVAFAYRLALYGVVNQLLPLKTRTLLILDEPTEGFSTEQLDRVRDILQSLPAKQIILVSHEQKLESFAQNVLRITKNSSISTVDSNLYK